MLENVLTYERDLFLWLNGLHNAVLDNFLWIYTGWPVWFPFILFLIIAFIYKKPWREWLPVIGGLVLVAGMGVLSVEFLIKPYFTRFRPTFHPDFMNDIKTLYDFSGEGLYGFISGHATFSFALATFTSLLLRYKPYTITVYIWAIIMVYSRIYLGVHFLTDILAGTLMGICIGLIVYYLYVVVMEKYIYPDGKYRNLTIYSSRRKKVITITFVCYILLLLLFSSQLIFLFRPG